MLRVSILFFLIAGTDTEAWPFHYAPRFMLSVVQSDRYLMYSMKSRNRNNMEASVQLPEVRRSRKHSRTGDLLRIIFVFPHRAGNLFRVSSDVFVMC